MGNIINFLVEDNTVCDKKGLCYGIAYTAVQSFVRGELGTFIKRLELIHNHESKNLVTRINHAEKYRKNKTNKIKDRWNKDGTRYCEDTLDKELKDSDYNDSYLLSTMRAFTESILYYGSYHYESGGEIPTESLETYNAARKAMSSHIQDYRPFAKFISKGKEDDRAFSVPTSKFRQTAHLPTEALFNDYLDKIIQTEGDLAFTIGNYNHVIAIFRQSESWTIINHDNIYQNLDAPQMKSLTHRSFSSGTSTIYSDFISIADEHELGNLEDEYFDDLRDRPMLHTTMEYGDTHRTKKIIDTLNCDVDSSGTALKEILAGKNDDGISALYITMCRGNTETLKTYLEGIYKHKSKLSTDELKSLLTGQDAFGYSALYVAMKNGQTETVSHYLNDITTFFGEEMLIAILQHICPGGASPLFVAMKNGYAETVRTYLTSIITHLDKEEYKEILLEKAPGGVSPLLAAMYNGHAETVSTYLKIVMEQAAKFSTEELKDLLVAKDADGFSALYVAMQNGQTETLSHYLYDISTCFGEEKLKAILQHICPGGASPLFVAMKNGYAETVRTYLTSIITHLDKEEYKEILLEKAPGGVSPLLAAMYNGHAETVSTYLKIIKEQAAKFSTEELKDLLVAKDAVGFSALYVAMKNGHAEVVNAYLTSISTLFKKEVYEETLLEKCPAGYSPLFVAMENGQTEAVNAYLNKINRLLSEEQLSTLLLGRDALAYSALEIAMQNGHVETVIAYIKTMLKFCKKHPTVELDEHIASTFQTYLSGKDLNDSNVAYLCCDFIYTCLQHKLNFSEDFLNDLVTNRTSNLTNGLLKKNIRKCCIMLKAVNRGTHLKTNGCVEMITKIDNMSEDTSIDDLFEEFREIANKKLQKTCGIFIGRPETKAIYSSFSNMEEGSISFFNYV